MSRIKVRFPLGKSIKDGVELMYAKPLSGNRFVLDNSPFYAFGISFGDEFYVEDTNDQKTFYSIASRGGHSTYRIKLPEGKDHNYFLSYWEKLGSLGCSYEGSSVNIRRLYAIDMPPDVDIHKAYSVLEEYENLGIWEFEEGHYCGVL